MWRLDKNTWGPGMRLGRTASNKKILGMNPLESSVQCHDTFRMAFYTSTGIFKSETQDEAVVGNFRQLWKTTLSYYARFCILIQRALYDHSIYRYD